MMGAALKRLGTAYELTKGLKTATLCNGINRIQWEGPWLKPGVPPAAAYKHTHWVAHWAGWVLCTAVESYRWVPVAWWAEVLKHSGEAWHVTHHYELPTSPEILANVPV